MYRSMKEYRSNISNMLEPTTHLHTKGAHFKDLRTSDCSPQRPLENERRKREGDRKDFEHEVFSKDINKLLQTIEETSDNRHEDEETCWLSRMSNQEDSGRPNEFYQLSLSSTPPMTRSVEEREFWPSTDNNNIPDSSSLEQFVNSPNFHSLGSNNINLDLTI